MKIFFIREGTTYGPFFSSKQKAIEYLVEEDNLASIIAGDDPYTSIEEVTLNDEEVTFDG